MGAKARRVKEGCHGVASPSDYLLQQWFYGAIIILKVKALI